MAPVINVFLNIGALILKIIFFVIASIFLSICGILFFLLLTLLFNETSLNQDPEFYELLSAIPNYFIIFSTLLIGITIVLSIITSFYVLFKKKSNINVSIILIFLWIVFFIITSISIPNIILILQDLDHLPYWINGFDNKSYYFNWIF